MRLRVGDIIFWSGGTYEITDESYSEAEGSLTYNKVNMITPPQTSDGSSLHSTNLSYNHIECESFYVISSNPQIEPRYSLSKKFQLV